MQRHYPAHLVPVRLTVITMVAILLAGALSAIGLPVNSAAAAPGSASSDVNLRSGPGEGYDVLTVVPGGAPISVDGDAVDGFFPVTYNGVSGWLSASYVIAGEAAPVAAYDTATDYVTDAGTAYYDPGTVVVYETDAGTSGNRNRRNNRGNANTNLATTDGTTGSAPPSGAIANPNPPATSEQEIISVIHQAAAAYGQNPDDMVRVARCESNLNPRAVDPSGSYHGLFQFVPSTFATTPYGGQDIYDPWANAHAAAWMWSEGKKSAWVCQ
jgi:uncharacterized protein YraI